MKELFCKVISEDIKDGSGSYVELLQRVAKRASSPSEFEDLGDEVGQAIDQWQNSDTPLDDLIAEVASKGVFLNLDAATHGGPWLSPVSNYKEIMEKPHVKGVVENLFERGSHKGLRIATTFLKGAWWTGRSFSRVSIINAHGVQKVISDLRDVIPPDTFWSGLDLNEIERIVEANQSAFGLMHSLCCSAHLTEDELASVETSLPGWLFESVDQFAELSGSTGALQCHPLGFVLELYRMLGDVRMSGGKMRFATGSSRDYVCTFIFEDLKNSFVGKEAMEFSQTIFDFAQKVHLARLSVSRTKGRKNRIEALHKARETIAEERARVTRDCLVKFSKPDWEKLSKALKSEVLKILSTLKLQLFQ